MPLKNTFASFIPNARSRVSGLSTNPFVRSAFDNIKTEIKKTDAYDQFHGAFDQASRVYGNIRTALDAIRIGSAGASVITGMLSNGENSPTNGDHSLLPFLSNSTTTPLGRNEAIFHRTRVHVGRRTSKRIKEIASGPFVEKVTKRASGSMDDYQEHNQRKNLSLFSGFHEKGFTFFLEDTYFSVQDFYKMFEIQNRFSHQLGENQDGVKDIYGCVYKVHNQFKFKNRNSQCTCHIRLHLIKILDIRTNVRSLLQEVTHNNSQGSATTNGRLPKDFQYTSPDLYNMDNKFAVSFLTNLSCRLTQSTKFKERAKIVRSWSSTLPPSSIWEFNLTTHFGRGVHLNTINDLYLDHETSDTVQRISDQLEKLKKAKKGVGSKTIDTVRSTIDQIFVKRGNEHPSSYVIAIEYVGDRRASIQRKENRDIFSGYSNCNIGVEFETFIKYLVSQDDDSPLVYKNIQQDRNFETGSDLAELFCPSRQTTFHVPNHQIGNKPTQPFKMIYDEILGSDTPSFMDDLKQTFKDIGLDPKSATPDDVGFDYRGPDTPAPPLEEENDKEDK